MQNAFSLTSKVPTVFNSLNTVSKSKVSSETQGSLLTLIPYKIKSIKQITWFQHTMVQNIITIPKWRKDDQHKNKNQQANSQFFIPSDLQLLSALLTATHFYISLSWACSTPFWQLFLVKGLWHLPYLGGSNAIQA